MPAWCCWFSCGANIAMARRLRLPLRSLPVFRAITFCRWNRATCSCFGKRDLAEQRYRSVWENGRAGKYGSLHYELAALALGDLLRGEKNVAAAAAYEQVGQIPSPDPEFLQKANLGAGEMYDQLQKRDLAIKKYQAVVAVDSGSREADLARKRMKEAYQE